MEGLSPAGAYGLGRWEEVEEGYQTRRRGTSFPFPNLLVSAVDDDVRSAVTRPPEDRHLGLSISLKSRMAFVPLADLSFFPFAGENTEGRLVKGRDLGSGSRLFRNGGGGGEHDRDTRSVVSSSPGNILRRLFPTRYQSHSEQHFSTWIRYSAEIARHLQQHQSSTRIAGPTNVACTVRTTPVAVAVASGVSYVPGIDTVVQ